MTTLRRLLRRLNPFQRHHYRDPAFTRRMQSARRYGLEQGRAALHSTRDLRQQRANRLEEVYLWEVTDE